METFTENSLHRKLVSFVGLLTSFCLLISCGSGQPKDILVLQSDFGLKDGAVSAMKGVASEVAPDLKIYDVTHEIPPFKIWDASYRLVQTAPYWPAGTVFVSVVDPGVGTNRKSVVLLTNTGHYFVTPDNGTLTLVAEEMGIKEIREIDEAVNRRQNSGQSYTFHGRDVYAFTGARLAAKVIRFEEVGKKLPNVVEKIAYQKPSYANGKVLGGIPILDIQYGNVWTNVDTTTFNKLNIRKGEHVKVQVFHEKTKKFEGNFQLVNTFGDAPNGTRVAYFNSLMKLSLAINMGNLSEKDSIFSGNDWNVILSK